MSRQSPARLRCAVYTRKSSEEGLEQGFNSLHAQREACEAYVLSQVGEGWSALATEYDDGGYSGGSMDRPGLRRLLADIDAGLIDIVVVYKVDRLTRSLTDFAKIVDTFDRRGVSFVSVTQAFNTTTSMGRLTLNVLLSFAQFEREVTGERIRDKIAASKAKGMWMGGNLPLGYDRPTDPLNRTLVVNAEEAETVRLIFRRYLELGSVHDLQRWLDAHGIRSKCWVSNRGTTIGGLPFGRGALFHLLKNRTYLGQIVHRERAYPGAHPGIVDREVFDQAQALLVSQARRHKDRPTRVSTMMLRGLIFDAAGQPMSPTFTHGSKRQVYRYYVSAPLQRGQRDYGADAITRVPAHLIEDLIRGLLARFGSNDQIALVRAEIHATTVQLVLRRGAFFPRPGEAQAEFDVLAAQLAPGERLTIEQGNADQVRVTIPCRLKAGGGKIWISDDAGRPLATAPRIDPTLIRALKAAHRLASGRTQGSQAAKAGPQGEPNSEVTAIAPAGGYERKVMPLAFLAPDIQLAILEGRTPAELNLQRLVEQGVPPSWKDQRERFGFAGQHALGRE